MVCPCNFFRQVMPFKNNHLVMTAPVVGGDELASIRALEAMKRRGSTGEREGIEEADLT
jgi:hypothetical protein